MSIIPFAARMDHSAAVIGTDAACDYVAGFGGFIAFGDVLRVVVCPSVRDIADRFVDCHPGL